jgi:hypothetical protein
MIEQETKVAPEAKVETEQTIQKTTTVQESPRRPQNRSNIVVRVIWYIAGLLLVLFAFRFVLALLGANLDNGFANFIFTTSAPFVSPFFGLFSYTPEYGVAQLEPSVLVAMAVYALVAWGMVKLMTITREP